MAARMMDRKPVWIVTGFLGSGKTTLLRSLIRLPALGHLAVVINEFGEESLDHDLVEASSDDTFTFEGGCLCCMVRGNLVDTLIDLGTRAHVGELPPFNGVVIETSGLADPVPVVDMLVNAPSFADFYRLNAVITVVDALNGERVLANEAVARAQLLAADYIVLTKGDICTKAGFSQVLSAVRDVAPEAQIHCVVAGATEALADLAPRLTDGEARLVAAMREELVSAGSRRPTHELAGVATHTLELPTPLDTETVSACKSLLSALAGPQLLRAKGVLVLRPPAVPTVLQAVQDMVYPPSTLTGTREDLHSRLVMITRDIDSVTIDQLLAERKLPRVSSADEGLSRGESYE